MKILEYPETRQTFCYDCGANGLVSFLVYGGVEEREDRVALLAKTTKNGTDPAGILRVLNYYGLPYTAGDHMQPDNLRAGIDQGFPTILALQAYRASHRPYRELWQDGHWVVAIGYDERRILFEDPSSFFRTWLGDQELHERWHDLDAKKRIIGWGCTLLIKGVYHHDLQRHME
jgi:ABC-type bacteriocin/lantibiotic exporter with double-glycine peptidase domain